MKSSLPSLIVLMILALLGGSRMASAAVESDLLAVYTATYAAGVGGTDNAQVTIANAVASSNAFNDRSGTGAQMRICAFYQSAQDNTGLTTTGGMVGWLANNDSRVADVVSYGSTVGADLVAYICNNSDSSSIAGVSQQPGMYSALNIGAVYSIVVAHETGGHGFGRSHSDGSLSTPKTIMLHNYCGGGSQGWFTNPKIWVNGVQLVGPGDVCSMGALINGGDNSNPSADSAMGVANRRERVLAGPNLSHVVKRWVFNNPAGAAAAGTVVTDQVTGTAAATVQGAGATFTGSSLRIPGGASGSGAAYLQLPSNLFTGSTAVTIELWATPLSAQNYGRILDFNNGNTNYLCLSSAIGTNLATQRFESKISGATVTLDSGLATTAGVQHHYAITFTPSGTGTTGTWTWYRDGDLIAFLDVAYALSAFPDVNSWLGRSAYSADAFANSDYAEVRISNVALTAGEVQANYRLGPNYNQTGTVTLTASDTAGTTTSFNGASKWSNSTAPTSGTAYETYTYSLRTPANTTPYTFAGSSLNVSGGNLLYGGTGSSTITVNNLNLKNGTVLHRGSGTWTLAGSVASLPNGGGTFSAVNGAINLTASLTGSSPLLFLGNNTTTLAGTNTAYTGQIQIGNGYLGAVSINSEARLGANPSVFTSDQLAFNRGTLLTTATMTLGGNANRGILLDISGGVFNVANGTTLTLSSKLSSPNLGAGIIAGSLGKANAGTLILNGPANTFTGTLYVDSGSPSANDGIVRVANNKVLATAHSPIYIRNNSSGSSSLQFDGSTENVTLSQGIHMFGRNTTVPQIESLSGSNTIGGIVINVGGSNYFLQSDAGSTLTVNGAINSLVTGNRTITFQGAGNSAATGAISNGTADSLSIAKTGAGTVTISGAGTYTGTTAVNGGTYKLNGSWNPATANSLTTAAGTTLSGTGSTNATAIVNGSHAPGNPVGTQTFTGSLAYGSTSRLKFTLNANSTAAANASKVTANTVDVTSGAALDVILNPAGTTVDYTNAFWTQARSWTVLSGAAITGTFALGNVSADANGRTAANYGTFALTQSATAVTLTFTPYAPLEVWKRTNFGVNWDNAAISGDTVDIDNDQLPNLVEYGLGSDPNVPSPTSVPKANTSGGKLTLSFTRNTAATDVTLTVRGADDLAAPQPWPGIALSDAGAAFVATASGATASESGSGATRAVQVGDIYSSSDPAHPTRFLRLEVTH